MSILARRICYSITPLEHATPPTGKTMTQPPAIELRDVIFAYPGGHPVIDISRWRIERGSRVFLKGPSGSGKSTLLHLIAGLLLPQSGDITVCGECVSSLKAHARDRFRAREIGIVYQQFNLLPYLTVQDNLRVAEHFGSGKSPVSASALLQRLRLPEEQLHRRVDQLSVGQQQRVAIARALINAPSLLIVDEPTSALDADARDTFISLLLEVAAAQQATVLFVSHDASLTHYFDQVTDLASLNSAQGRESTHVA